MYSRKFWMIVTLSVIWVSVLAASLFTPDLVTGSEQAHTPLAAIVTWLFGLGATQMVLKLMGWPKYHAPDTAGVWRTAALSVSAIWLAAAGVTIFGPVRITGADPTQFPVGVLIGPVAGLVLTGLVRQLLEGHLASQKLAAE